MKIFNETCNENCNLDYSVPLRRNELYNWSCRNIINSSKVAECNTFIYSFSTHLLYLLVLIHLNYYDFKISTSRQTSNERVRLRRPSSKVRGFCSS